MGNLSMYVTIYVVLRLIYPVVCAGSSTSGGSFLNVRRDAVRVHCSRSVSRDLCSDNGKCATNTYVCNSCLIIPTTFLSLNSREQGVIIMCSVDGNSPIRIGH